MDTVRVTQQITAKDQYGNSAHYQVSFERRRAESGSTRFERVGLEVRVNGVSRLQVELPGEVGMALFWAVREAFEKFDIEAIAGRKVSI